MPVQVADGRYDQSHPYDSLYNGPADNPVKTSPYTRALMDTAEAMAEPGASGQIRASMMNVRVADWGPVPDEPTIESVLSGQALQVPQATFSDYSGSNGSYEGSVRNHIEV